MNMSKTLVITNDFPPRPGGIQTFVHGLIEGLDPNEVVVLSSKYKGWQEFDKAQKYPVFRHDTEMLLPTKAVGDHALKLIKEHNCESVLFGASSPLGLLSSRLKSNGVKKTVALTHGHEVGWAFTPGLKQTFQKIVKDVDKLTYLTKFTYEKIAEAISDEELTKFEQLTPGIDINMFNPENVTNGQAKSVRDRFKLGDKPVVVCVSRLMPRKGQDTLIDLWPEVLKQVPNAHLLIVGGGPYKQHLHKQMFDNEVHQSVTITGSVSWNELPGFYAAGDVFAMPVRTRNLGFDVEGLGIVYLEASACGLPVIAGSSGGAPDAVVNGVTGFVVDGENDQEIASAAINLLKDIDGARAMGQAGRGWIIENWRWEIWSKRFNQLLE